MTVDGDSSNDEKWIDLGHLLESCAVGHANGLDVENEGTSLFKVT